MMSILHPPLPPPPIPDPLPPPEEGPLPRPASPSSQVVWAPSSSSAFGAWHHCRRERRGGPAARAFIVVWRQKNDEEAEQFVVSSSSPAVLDQAHNQLPPNLLPMQGRTLKTDLLIVGPKIYSDAAYRTKKVPGLLQGEVATGVGVYISMPFNQKEINVQVQASASPTSTPLQAEALALSFAAHLASQLNIAQPTFLLDCLALALAVASGCAFARLRMVFFNLLVSHRKRNPLPCCAFCRVCQAEADHDTELEAIRQRRVQELMGQHGGARWRECRVLWQLRHQSIA
ncbi:uncharacterized protein LOC125538345 [Triticum urartu]|uniref:uncharacterized protein LOC125538345 n=1 Tax=Triticum urartu TaxID=4572 RepID=UPI0020441749|nr:uncharacterized protein LOC125538345 [Triticum urartu]